jgi:N-acetyl-gamma-glutamyl-phosphate reductase
MPQPDSIAIRPLIEAGVIDLDEIILDLKAGVSGAGRSLKENLLHAELSGGTHPYSAGGTHRHLGEFDQEFSKVAGRPVMIQFTPHLMPFNRGILATCLCAGRCGGDLWRVGGALRGRALRPCPSDGAGCLDPVHRRIELRASGGDRLTGSRGAPSWLRRLTILPKGSSGQAIQNANLMLGLEETAGLMLAPVFPHEKSQENQTDPGHSS